MQSLLCHVSLLHLHISDTCPSTAAVCQAASHRSSSQWVPICFPCPSRSRGGNSPLPPLLAPTFLIISWGSLNSAHTSVNSPSTTSFSKSQLSWPHWKWRDRMSVCHKIMSMRTSYRNRGCLAWWRKGWRRQASPPEKKWRATSRLILLALGIE